jgi:hypothetical protein
VTREDRKNVFSSTPLELPPSLPPLSFKKGHDHYLHNIATATVMGTLQRTVGEEGKEREREGT